MSNWGRADGAEHEGAGLDGPEHRRDGREGPGHDGTARGIRGLSQLLRLLSEETRLKILYTLAEGERDVSGLWGPMRLPQATVSHHLSFLRLAGLVSTRRAGKHIHYRLGPGARSAGPGVLAIQCPDFALRLELRGAPGGPVSSGPQTSPDEGTSRDHEA